MAGLVKKPKDGYSNCIADIQAVLCPLSFIDICNLDDVVTQTKDYVLRKIRIPNTEQNWGKSQGYRLILLCDISTETIYLLCIYPKKGKLESPDLTAKGATILLDKYAVVKQDKELFCVLCN